MNNCPIGDRLIFPLFTVKQPNFSIFQNRIKVQLITPRQRQYLDYHDHFHTDNILTKIILIVQNRTTIDPFFARQRELPWLWFVRLSKEEQHGKVLICTTFWKHNSKQRRVQTRHNVTPKLQTVGCMGELNCSI